MHAGDRVQVTASAQGVLSLTVRIFDEGGRSISGAFTGWSLACSWAHDRIAANPNAEGLVCLPSVTMPGHAAVPTSEHIQLFHVSSTTARATEKLSLRSVPLGVHETGSLVLHDPDILQPGKPCCFCLKLEDADGISISQPAEHFELCRAIISWESAEPEACECNNGSDLTFDAQVPANLVPGSHSISCEAELKPKNHMLQQLPSDDPVYVSAQLDMDVSPGPATQIALTAPETCRELDRIQIVAQARDAAGSDTTDVGELTLAVEIGDLSADLVPDSSRCGAWKADVAIALIPNSCTISLKAQDANQLTFSDAEIIVSPSSRICAIQLQLAECQQNSVTVNCPFKVVAELQLGDDAPSRSISVADAGQGLEVMLQREGQPTRKCKQLESSSPGLRFEFEGTCPKSAGPACIQATWTEQDPVLRSALNAAQQGFMDASPDKDSPWQAPASSQVALDIVPDAPEALQACWVRDSAAVRFTSQVRARGKLPRLGIRVLDTFGNYINLHMGSCTFDSQLWVSKANAAKGCQVPQLEGSASTFTGSWNETFKGFVLPEAASKLSEEDYPASARYQVQYAICMAASSGLPGLDSARVSFWYKPSAEVSRQTQFHDAWPFCRASSAAIEVFDCLRWDHSYLLIKRQLCADLSALACFLMRMSLCKLQQTPLTTEDKHNKYAC